MKICPENVSPAITVPTRVPLRWCPLGPVVLLALMTVTGLPRPLPAQDPGFLPDLPAWEYPLASPRVNALVGRILQTDEADNLFGTGTEAEVVAGEDFPVVRLAGGGGGNPVTLGLGFQVYGRFSLDDPKSSLISSDWLVSLNVQKRWVRWDLTLQLYHESSHLGDEYLEKFGQPRLDWTREVAAVWVGRTLGPFRLVGSGSYVLSDGLGLDPLGASLAGDFQGFAFRLGSIPARVVAGVYAEGYEATDWRISTTARAGIALSGGKGGRELSLSLVAHDGLSTQRQFFRAESRYLGLEIRFDL